jgi:type 2 lantibiotic (TIGR03893 family)
MSEINTKAIVGDTFEDLSLAEMTLVQGLGDDVNVETTPAATSAIVSLIGTAILSIFKC